MTPQEIRLVKRAMAELENIPCSGIGADGYTIDELDEMPFAEEALEDDTPFQSMQYAWRLLEAALSVEGES